MPLAKGKVSMPAKIAPKNVSYKNGNKQIPTALFLPTNGKSEKLVILAYGSDGLMDKWKAMLEAFARDLAQAGIAAAIPDYFASTGTRAGDLNPKDFDRYALQIMKGQDTWVATLKTGVRELAQTAIVPGIQPARVGLLGFSLGGVSVCAGGRGNPGDGAVLHPDFSGSEDSGSLEDPG